MKNNIYINLFFSFLKTGLFTIGGGLAMIPLIQKYVVEDKGWLTDEEMMDGLAVAQSLPGVVAINIATYVGKKKAGFLGALAATVGVILPSFVIIIMVSLFLGAAGSNRYVYGALMGIKASACGLILWAGIKLGKNILKSPLAWVVAAASFLAVIVLKVSVVYVILGAALIGIVANFIKSSREVA